MGQQERVVDGASVEPARGSSIVPDKLFQEAAGLLEARSTDPSFMTSNSFNALCAASARMCSPDLLLRTLNSWEPRAFALYSHIQACCQVAEILSSRGQSSEPFLDRADALADKYPDRCDGYTKADAKELALLARVACGQVERAAETLKSLPRPRQLEFLYAAVSDYPREAMVLAARLELDQAPTFKRAFADQEIERALQDSRSALAVIEKYGVDGVIADAPHRVPTLLGYALSVGSLPLAEQLIESGKLDISKPGWLWKLSKAYYIAGDFESGNRVHAQLVAIDPLGSRSLKPNVAMELIKGHRFDEAIRLHPDLELFGPLLDEGAYRQAFALWEIEHGQLGDKASLDSEQLRWLGDIIEVAAGISPEWAVNLLKRIPGAARPDAMTRLFKGMA